MEISFDYYRPEVPRGQAFDVFGSFLYSHACHTLDQVISRFGKPDRVQADVRQLLGRGCMNDYFDLDLFFGHRLKASVKSSYFRAKARPSVVVYGMKGMFIKEMKDKQEEHLKMFFMPGEPGFGEDMHRSKIWSKLIMIPVLKKVSPMWGLGICFVLFILCKRIQYGYIGIGGGMQVPAAFYSIKILTPLGFPFPGFRSSDYFPLIPWMFLYLCGYFSNEIFRENDTWKTIARHKVPILSTIGRRTIWIYLLHQPVSMLVCSLVFG